MFAATSIDFSKSMSDDGKGTAATGGNFTGAVGGGVAGTGAALATGAGVGFFSADCGAAGLLEGGGAVIVGSGGAADDGLGVDLLVLAGKNSIVELSIGTVRLPTMTYLSMAPVLRASFRTRNNWQRCLSRQSLFQLRCQWTS